MVVSGMELCYWILEICAKCRMMRIDSSRYAHLLSQEGNLIRIWPSLDASSLEATARPLELEASYYKGESSKGRLSSNPLTVM